MTTILRPSADFNVDAITTVISYSEGQLRTLRRVQRMVVAALVLLTIAVIAGMITIWSIFISIAGFIYGIGTSSRAINGLKDALRELEQQKLTALWLNRYLVKFHHYELKKKPSVRDLVDWLDINTPGSSIAADTPIIISFSSEDARILFRLTHL